MTPIAALVLSNTVFQGVLPIRHPNLSFFFTLLFTVSAWSVGIATAILLYYRDVGPGLAAWGTVILVWVLLFAWRFQGNLIELSFLSVIHPDQLTPIWWFSPLLCVFGWIIPLSILGFLGHTLRLLLHEWK